MVEVGVADVEGCEQAAEHVGVEVASVRDAEWFVGEAVARQVERDGAVGLAELGEDVAVEVRAGWEAVEKEDWRAGAGLRVADAEVVDLGLVARWLGDRIEGEANTRAHELRLSNATMFCWAASCYKCVYSNCRPECDAPPASLSPTE